MGPIAARAKDAAAGRVATKVALPLGESPEAGSEGGGGLEAGLDGQVGVQQAGVQMLRAHNGSGGVLVGGEGDGGRGNRVGSLLASLGSRQAPANVQPAASSGSTAGSQAALMTSETTSTTLVRPLPSHCNLTAPIFKPGPELRSWKLGVAWRRACESKSRHKDWYPFERNWCWVGFKAECHANLKSHRSWTTIQEMAAEEGNAPPVSRAPFYPLKYPEICDRPHFGQSRTWTQQDWRTSYDWAKENLALYVLNLPQDVKRWEVISARLEVLNIKASRVLGVDMRIPGSLWTAKHAGWVPKDFRFDRAQEVANEPRQGMGSILGTLGCASAHFKVQTKAIIDNYPLAVVLEDDSWPEDDFVPRLWSLVTTELPCDWEAVALMSRCPYGVCVSPHLLRVQPDGNEPLWRCHQGVNWGMHGVLYRTATLPALQVKWKAAVFDETRPHCMDVDVGLASISDKVGFYAVPAVQKPGFLYEMDEGSSRYSINMGAAR